MDWDSSKAMQAGLMQWRLIQEYGHWQGYTLDWTPSRTRGHYHAVLTATHELSDMDRILFSCLLCTDVNNARLNYCRVLADAPWPILLIERKQK